MCRLRFLTCVPRYQKSRPATRRIASSVRPIPSPALALDERVLSDAGEGVEWEDAGGGDDVGGGVIVENAAGEPDVVVRMLLALREEESVLNTAVNALICKMSVAPFHAPVVGYVDPVLLKE